MAGSNKSDREARQRLRRYEANQAVHEHQTRRRRRDNIAAVVALVGVAALATTVQVLYFSNGPGAPADEPTASAEPSASAEAADSAVPSPDLAENRTWTGDLVINGVELEIELDGEAAPQGVANFVALSQDDFYEGVSCHRLTTGDNFRVLQCGDPNGDGTGGPGYQFGPIENAPSDDLYTEGTIAMARQGGNPDSMGSQFFIVYGDTTIPSDAAGGYTVLGEVTSGLDDLRAEVTDAGTAEGTADGAPAVETTIDSVSVE